MGARTAALGSEGQRSGFEDVPVLPRPFRYAQFIKAVGELMPVRMDPIRMDPIRKDPVRKDDAP
jgi:hypothetical protein